MDIGQDLVDIGTVAVIRYKEISGIDDDNLMPESFLPGFIAAALYDRRRCLAHVERHYTKIANELKIPESDSLMRQLGDCRADLVIYENGQSPAIVEIKVFRHQNSAGGVLEKNMDNIKSLFTILDNTPSTLRATAYIAAMICENNRNLPERRQEINSFLDNYGEIHKTNAQLGRSVAVNGGTWKWQFVCWRVY